MKIRKSDQDAAPPLEIRGRFAKVARMSKIINLSRFRKDKARAEKRVKADANAAKHGRSRAEKAREAAQTDKARRDLDGHKLE